jgi:hypothetical protein
VPHIALSVHLSYDQKAAAVAIGALAVAGAVWLVLRRKRPSADEIERARRQRLVRVGRITDGSLVDLTTLDGSFLDDSAPSAGLTPAPNLLMFRYQIAGVMYETAQDVSTMPDLVRGMRIDLPIQVRYDYQNPANSIVVAEEWSGIRTRPKPREHSGVEGGAN